MKQNFLLDVLLLTSGVTLYYVRKWRREQVKTREELTQKVHDVTSAVHETAARVAANLEALKAKLAEALKPEDFEPEFSELEADIEALSQVGKDEEPAPAPAEPPA